MIIWGSKGQTTDIGSGVFHCPQCQRQEGYSHKRVDKYFTLYFIPLFRTDTLGEYIECRGCRGDYKPEVLSYRPAPPPVGNMAATLLRVRAALEAGTSFEAACEALVNAGMPGSVAVAMVNEAGVTPHKKCPGCRLSFHSTLTRCSHCGTALDPGRLDAVASS